MTIAPAELVDHYAAIDRERMQGLPIVNQELAVEAVGFRAFDAHRLGILITPWFMNLVLLPATDDWDGLEAGAAVELTLPDRAYEFRICRDDTLGTYLSAVLFRTVTDFPDQSIAREVAEEILERLFTEPANDEARTVSRRSLFTGLEAH